MNLNQELRVLAVGLSKLNLERIRAACERCAVMIVASAEDFLKDLDGFNGNTADVFLCGDQLGEIQPIEAAQSLRMKAPQMQIYFVGTDGVSTDDTLLLKNGYDEVFLMPFDEDGFRQRLRRLESAVAGIDLESYVQVSLVDLDTESSFEFDVSVFLPLNNKYVKIVKRGKRLRESLRKNLEEGSVTGLFIPQEQMQAYQSYAAARLRALKSVADTPEGKERLQKSVRSLFHDLLSSRAGSFDSGRTASESSQKIVAELVGSPEVFDLRAEIARRIGQLGSDTYARSVRISTFASLFALASGACPVEDAAIAALFLDIGLIDVAQADHDRPLHELPADLREKVIKHPEASVRVLKEKRMALPPGVQSAILEHHERADGKGYPHALSAGKISAGAQVVAVATAFDDLTVLKPGRARLNAGDAFEILLNTGAFTRDLIVSLKKVS